MIVDPLPFVDEAVLALLALLAGRWATRRDTEPVQQEDLEGPMDVTGRGSDDGPIGTPTVSDGVVYALGPHGAFVALGLEDGKERWRRELDEDNSTTPLYGYTTSPVVVDDTLIVAVDCEVRAALRAYDVTDAANPSEQWEIAVTGGCIESTPAIWNGTIYVGSRDGYFYAIGR